MEFQYEVKANVALHYHTGRWQSDAEAKSAQELLSRIPGLNLIDIGTDPRFGRHCTSLSGIAELVPGQKVLDVGSGVGGPVRRMASKYGPAV